MRDLDSYDPFTKWHTFAFRADRARLGELRVALEPWISYRDLVPLIAFRDRYEAEYRRDLLTTTVATDRAFLRSLLPLVDETGLDPNDVGARIETIAPQISRHASERLRALPKRLERLSLLREAKAPETIVSEELRLMKEAFALAGLAPQLLPLADDVPYPIEPTAASNEEVQYLFERCIELVVRDPFAPNLGYGRLYGMVDDMLVPYGIPLIDPEWPVHYQNADGGPAYAYGMEGFEISVLDGNDRDDIATYDLSLDEIKKAALDMVSSQLSDEGVDLYDGFEPGDASDPDDYVRDLVEQDYADRAAFMCRELFAEWQRAKTNLLEALDDVAANRCAVLHWSAKNPSL